MDEKNFLSYVVPEPNTGCWLWVGAHDNGGYGIFRNQKAHRFSYTLHRGEIPEGLVLDHLCRVRCCVNPNHLEAVTAKENIRRGEVSLIHGSKTNCPYGHPYDVDNIYYYKNSRNEVLKTRACRICKLIKQQAYRDKKRVGPKTRQRKSGVRYKKRESE